MFWSAHLVIYDVTTLMVFYGMSSAYKTKKNAQISNVLHISTYTYIYILHVCIYNVYVAKCIHFNSNSLRRARRPMQIGVLPSCTH